MDRDAPARYSDMKKFSIVGLYDIDVDNDDDDDEEEEVGQDECGFENGCQLGLLIFGEQLSVLPCTRFAGKS